MDLVLAAGWDRRGTEVAEVCTVMTSAQDCAECREIPSSPSMATSSRTWFKSAFTLMVARVVPRIEVGVCR